MVRLEEVIYTRIERVLDVSIPIWCDWKWISSIKRFSWVEFQFLYGAIGSWTELGFYPRFRVSIPIWCDWKCGGNWKRDGNIWFQFLYGAIGRPSARSTYRVPRSFNSYMVRLEACWRNIRKCSKYVSIPIWCDWKLPSVVVDRNDRCVSIPIWCDWKFEDVLYEEIVRRVSIPIWCDWKAFPEEWFFHALNVSIPIWCDWKSPPCGCGWT